MEALIDDLAILITALKNEDIHTIVRMIDKLRFDHRNAHILDIVDKLIIRSITQWMRENKQPLLVVKKLNIYKEETADHYKFGDNGELLRNCKPAKWSSTGTLYQAYRQIHPKTDEV